MKNKGYTLIEVLAVVLLLGLLSLLVTPKVLEIKEKKEKELYENKKNILYSNTDTYIDNNKNEYPIRSGNVFCIRIQDLIDENMLSVDFSDFNTNQVVKISVDENEKFIHNLVYSSECTEVK